MFKTVQGQDNKQVFTVSQLNMSARILLEQEFGQMWLTGEISNFSQPSSGHWYLTLKDDRAQVRAAMFAGQNRKVSFKPQNGQQVLVKASVSLYEPRGDYQLLITEMQDVGDGLLQQQFDHLKTKLNAEGLFASEYKQKIAHFNRRIGIITSPTGAALQDILNVLKRRDPALEIIIYPTAVQGKEATKQIVDMLNKANLRQECDVLLVTRGGGSLEDLWCFNEEAVARAIFASKIPIISAVGHETDVTIADFVADLRAPTPSAAAELVSRNQAELYQQLQNKQQRLEMAFDRLYMDKKQYLIRMILKLKHQHPQNKLQLQMQTIQTLHQSLVQSMNRILTAKQHQYNYLQQRLEIAFDRLYTDKKQYLIRMILELKHQHPQNKLQLQMQTIQTLQQSLVQTMHKILTAKQHQYNYLHQNLINTKFITSIKYRIQNLTQLKLQLNYNINSKLNISKQQLANLLAKLDSLSPLQVLVRGYAIAENQQNQVITSIKQVSIDEQINIQLHDGIISSKVTSVGASELQVKK